MTIGGWIGFLCVVLVVVLLGGFIFLISETTSGKMLCVGGSLAVIFITFGGMLFYYNATASGKRAFKSQKSELENGIERVVTVYDMEGDVIKVYDGKFDITYDNDRILFDDEQGKRHVIYYPTGTVTVDEK